MDRPSRAGLLLLLLALALAVTLLTTLSSRSGPSATDIHAPRLHHLELLRHPRPRELWTPADFECVGWRATRACDPLGARDPAHDRRCDEPLLPYSAGFCEVRNRSSGEVFHVMRATCSAWWWKKVPTLTCADARAFTDFSIRAARFTQSSPPTTVSDNNNDSRRGIALIAYPKVVAGVYAIVRTLRSLGCTLPIELWIHAHEMRASHSVLQALVTHYNAVVRVITDPRATAFLAKPYAVYHSQFESVLFLDSDNVPLRDPTDLFASREFATFGTLFWPDYWRAASLASPFNGHAQSAVWELLDMPFIDMFEQESGQLLVNRSRTAAALEKLLFYATATPTLLTDWTLVYGDKDLFRFAWLNTSTPFYFDQHLLALGGLYDSTSDTFCGLAMLQRDAQGEFVFMHRNQAKLNGRRDQSVLITHVQTFTGGAGVATVVESELDKYRVLTKRQWMGQRMCFLLDPETPAGDRTPYEIQSVASLPFAELEHRAILFSIEGRGLMSREEEAELVALEASGQPQPTSRATVVLGVLAALGVATVLGVGMKVRLRRGNVLLQLQAKDRRFSM